MVDIYHLYVVQFEIRIQVTKQRKYEKCIKIWSTNIFGKVVITYILLIYGIIASYLGTDKYSIHTICYSVCLSLEIITNAYQATLMIKVPIKESYEQQYETVMKIKKKCFPLIIVLNYIFCFIYLVISHGSLPLEKCFPYIIFYSFGVFGLYPYETYKTLCITRRKTTNIVSRFNNWSTC